MERLSLVIGTPLSLTSERTEKSLNLKTEMPEESPENIHDQINFEGY
jgi:hypothetical protein